MCQLSSILKRFVRQGHWRNHLWRCPRVRRLNEVNEVNGVNELIGVWFEKFFIVLYRCFTLECLMRHKKVLY